MQLQINNFAKIKSAVFSINGITVIAGNNNTGKSTIGKIISSVFNSLSDINSQIERTRIAKMAADAESAIFSEIPTRNFFPAFFSHFSPNIEETSAKSFLNANSEEEKETAVNEFGTYIRSNFYSQKAKVSKEKINAIIYDVFEKSSKISNKKLESQILSIYFQRVFNNQINNILSPDKIAKVSVTVKKEVVDIEFKSNIATVPKRGFSITNSATYIENPYIIDKLNQSLRANDFRFSLSSLELNLFDKLYPKEEENIGIAAIEQLSVEKSLKEVIGRLNTVIPGDIELKDSFVYNDRKGHILNLNSLSTGLKSFAVIKQLLLKRSLKNKDILILDEPEIHLHPEWQLKYAEIIVLLQKVFDLNIIITTHSPHFLESIDIYSKLHKSDSKCTYYLAEDNEDGIEFLDVTSNLQPIYKSLVSPNLFLDGLNAKLEFENE